MTAESMALPERGLLRGSFSIDQIRRWALAGLRDSATSPQLIALLQHHRALTREAQQP